MLKILLYYQFEIPYGQFKLSFNDISQPKIIKNGNTLISISIIPSGILGSILIKKSLLSFIIIILLLIPINYLFIINNLNFKKLLQFLNRKNIF